MSAPEDGQASMPKAILVSSVKGKKNKVLLDPHGRMKLTQSDVTVQKNQRVVL